MQKIRSLIYTFGHFNENSEKSKSENYRPLTNSEINAVLIPIIIPFCHSLYARLLSVYFPFSFLFQFILAFGFNSIQYFMYACVFFSIPFALILFQFWMGFYCAPNFVPNLFRLSLISRVFHLWRTIQVCKWDKSVIVVLACGLNTVSAASMHSTAHAHTHFMDIAASELQAIRNSRSKL